MEQYLNLDFHKALHLIRINGLGSFEAEKAALGYTHCDVASWLTGTWSLPDNIVQPLVYHHEPEEAAASEDAVMICHIADAICNAPSEAALGGMMDGLARKAAAAGLDAPDLEQVIKDMQAELENAAMFIER
jgi:hypothetical protein